jgi:(2Fe-2S) ferredoxin
MAKLTSWDELKKYRETAREDSSLLNSDSSKTVLAVGEATCGIAAGAKKIQEVLEEEIKRQGLKNIQIIATGCYGYCFAEPMVEVRKPGQKSVYYGFVTEEVAKAIVDEHLVKGHPVEKNVLDVEVLVP